MAWETSLPRTLAATGNGFVYIITQQQEIWPLEQDRDKGLVNHGIAAHQNDWAIVRGGFRFTDDLGKACCGELFSQPVRQGKRPQFLFRGLYDAQDRDEMNGRLWRCCLRNTHRFRSWFFLQLFDR